MKVLYDGQAFSMQHFGGVSRCFCELIKWLPKDVKYDISVKACNNMHLLTSGLIDIERIGVLDKAKWLNKYTFKGCGIAYKLLNLIGLIHGLELENKRYSIEKLKEKDFDIFHATFFDDYFLKYIGDKPFVITIHDMIIELFPQEFPKKEEKMRKALLCEKATAIVAVSQKTKDDLIKILGVPSEKITVVYHGGPEKEQITQPRIIERPYFLYVGQRRRYKNFNQTLVDFSQFSKYHNDVCLVCTGSKFTDKELQFINELGINDRVIQMKVSDEEMKNLYAYAIAFIYPSVYEGFGMPILEAYAYGCLTMLNDKSCFREIGGDAAIYFDSVEGKSDLPQKLESVISMSIEERERYRQMGYERLTQFSWKKSAQRLAEVYHKVCSL